MMNKEILLREWQTVGPTEDERLAHCPPFTAEEAEYAVTLGRSKRVEVLEVRGGLRVSTSSYVGTVRLGPTTLQIRPKLAELSPTAMVSFLRYALGMNMVSAWDNAANVPLEPMAPGDLIALALLEEVNGLFRTGILQDYETHSTWRNSPRGRLDLDEFARNPMRARTALALPCRVSEQVTDTTLNRLVRATLEAARLLVVDSGIAFDLHNRAAALGELCRDVPLTQSLITDADTAMDRRSWHYQPILALAVLIVQGLGVTVGAARPRASLSSFLLDMNVLFERFLSRLLCEYSPPGLRVATQVEHGFAYRWRENPYRWQRPRLRPDIVLYDTITGEPNLILDAKYKPLDPARRPSSEDLYQLTLYSLSFGARNYVPSRIVYPDVLDPATTSVPRLDFQGRPGISAVASVSFHRLPMLSITAALRSQNERELRQIIRSLTNVDQ